MATTEVIPAYDVDFYSDAVIRDPLPHYAALRELGPVAWLPKQNAYVLTRYAEVVEALRKPDVFVSGKGLSLNDDVNALLIGNSLNSDGEEHRRKRSITATPINPKGIVELTPYIEQAAEQLADTLVARGRFDAVADFAQILPLTIVTELVGLSETGKANMLTWASAAFNLFEGYNKRSVDAFDDLRGLQQFLAEEGRPDRLKEGGLARRIFEEAPAKGFSQDEAAQLMRDYINPSLDTTISALGFAAYHFAKDPAQWDILRDDPSLIPNAIEEIVRLSTPIRAFSRFVAEDYAMSGVTLPQGSRVIVVYASANRDPRVFENPDTFDVTRNVRKHVGFGHGVHMCMGLHLARLEMRSVLASMLNRVTRWALDGAPVVAMNNTIRAFERLPVRVLA
ncbi:cytochrome P450 [Amylibacter sp. IMCC11727]|uniref:cytochrome P450 n=1 Tax=Amylibacter sp. IMCC11727 TaxID=3039851 RepID=UPI00244E149B|nr:cytochrome P450 [Amylibacter sp. IMCC11727]WGI22566.1 cytochrome P450 [Amylibacter sp. IMCC11727]